MKTFQAICLLALSKVALGDFQKPLTAASVDDVIAHETSSSTPPEQSLPPYKDPFEPEGKYDPAAAQLLHLTGDGDDAEQEVYDVDEDFTRFPKVEMDYATYRATKYHKKGDYYTYKNIRYAAPPVGPLRFAAPQPPLKEEGIQTGEKGHSCIQAVPNWMTAKTRPKWLIKTIFGTHTDSEDCLFLDVSVPSEAKEGDNLPVVVWIFGGGYIFGKKEFSPYNPTGLFRRTDGNMIYVAMNYRMGAYGFLTGPLFAQERDEGILDGVPNAALHDQRFALKWVQKYIAKFGGDPDNVTIMGESAGGGSIVHQLVWQDPEEEQVPFQRAIPQSPAWVPVPGGYKAADDLQDNNYKAFLAATGCFTLQCLRQKDPWVLKLANAYLVGKSPMGTFTFGPSVDGKYIPDLPGKMLKAGKFSMEVDVMVGLVGNEGAAFADKSVKNASMLDAYLKSALPLSSPETRKKIYDLYPASNFGGNYTNLAIFLAGESFINCNSYYLAKAYEGKSYHYILNRTHANSENAAGHGADVSYTFWNNWPLLTPTNGFLANALQKYLIGFFTSGDPNSQKITWGPNFRKWGEESEMLQFDGKTWLNHKKVDDAALERCDWWQDAHYANPEEGKQTAEGKELK